MLFAWLSILRGNTVEDIVQSVAKRRPMQGHQRQTMTMQIEGERRSRASRPSSIELIEAYKGFGVRSFGGASLSFFFARRVSKSSSSSWQPLSNRRRDEEFAPHAI
jgi:hypothetical protein